MAELIKTAWADTRVGRALERELRTGFQLEKENEKMRVQGAASYAEEVKKAGEHMKSMKLTTVIPQRDFHRLVQKYGHDEVHSKGFIRHLHKTMPDLKVASV